jgi:hypothetical protein
MGDFKRLVAWQDEAAPLCFSLTRIPPQSD